MCVTIFVTHTVKRLVYNTISFVFNKITSQRFQLIILRFITFEALQSEK